MDNRVFELCSAFLNKKSERVESIIKESDYLKSQELNLDKRGYKTISLPMFLINDGTVEHDE